MGSSIWQIGDQLRVRGQRWTLRDLTAWPASTELRLSSPRRSAFTILTPFDRPTTAGSAMGIRTVHARRFLHVLRRAVAAATPYGGSIAAARAAVQLLSHQLEPLLAMVRHGIARVLVADAVGLGKTIQAGLILLELAAREAGFRALLLIPAGLKAQWRQELRDRFALEVEDADATWLRRAAADRPADVNPWSLPGIYLTSIDFAKRPEVLRSLEDTTWDLVVLDEAHAAAGASDRRRAAHALACRSRRVLLLTATPDIGDPAAFTALCTSARSTDMTRQWSCSGGPGRMWCPAIRGEVSSYACGRRPPSSACTTCSTATRDASWPKPRHATTAGQARYHRAPQACPLERVISRGVCVPASTTPRRCGALPRAPASAASGGRGSPCGSGRRRRPGRTRAGGRSPGAPLARVNHRSCAPGRAGRE